MNIFSNQKPKIRPKFKIFNAKFSFLNFQIVNLEYYSKLISRIWNFSRFLNKKKLIATSSIVLLIIVFTTAQAASPQKAKNYKKLQLSKISGYSAVIIDDKSGEVLFGKREEEKKPLASITKIAGAYVFLEENPNLNKKTSLIGSDEVGGGRLRLPLGTTLKLKDLLYSSLVGSANNAATALIRTSGLSKSSFIDKMEDLADSAGASQKTNFVDACGVSPENTSTPKDIALIGKKVFSSSLICKISSDKKYSFYINGGKGKKTISHTSPIVSKKSSVYKILAAKTGYLPEVGYNLIVKTKSKKGSNNVIAVVFGAKSTSASSRDIQKMIKWVYGNYKWK